MLSSPRVPWKGARDRHGGPPYFWFAEVASPAPDRWHVKLTREGASPEQHGHARDRRARKEPPRPVKGNGVWPVRAAWDRGTENLYLAWTETLFDAPLD